ncbi:MAG TPA: phosphonate ABC transporter, permease protein PhnE [Alphaproteobacteria bacterium]|nr:phosphonate ABC transporter, permease protein PhnE [Alphaproteobacteria bacterium]
MRALSAEEVSGLRARFPQAFGAPPAVKLARGVLLALVIGYVGYLVYKLGFISPTFIAGWAKLGDTLAKMLPPSFHDSQSAHDIPIGIVETVAMAFLGSVFAGLIAIPLGFLGARTVIGSPIIHFLVRRVYDFFRGIPPLIWALIFTRAVGLGPMTGVLAFIAADFAALAKLNAEAIETVDAKPIEGVRSAGASGFAVLRFGLLPQILPVMLGQALYFFESDVRAAAILGIVGAGGIGRILDQSMRLLYWREVGMIILLFLITVALIDFGSRWLRRRLIGGTS